MWLLGRVGIYRVLLYNLYSGVRVTDVPYIYNNNNDNNNNNNNIWIANVQLVYVGLAQARPNYAWQVLHVVTWYCCTDTMGYIPECMYS